MQAGESGDRARTSERDARKVAEPVREERLPGGIVIRWRASDRRRLGRGLIAFGAIGLILLAVAAVMMLGSFGTLGGLAGLDAQRRAIADGLGAASDSLGDAASGATDLQGSVANAAAASRQASGLATELASTMRDLSAATNVSIFGSQPLAGLGSGFDRVGERSTALAAQLDTLGASLDRGASDGTRVTTDLLRIRDQVDGLRANVGGTDLVGALDTFSALRIVLLGLLIWLAVPAIGTVLLGRCLLQAATPV